MTLVDFIVDVEGCRLKAYDIEGDVAGVDTIGVGHLLTDDELDSGELSIGGERIEWRNGITKGQARNLLAQDLAEYVACVNHAVKVTLSENQKTALVSFCFNVGRGAFTRSTLLKRLNAGEYDAVPGELHRWIRNNGKVIKGLINRRIKEAAMWSGQIA